MYLQITRHLGKGKLKAEAGAPPNAWPIDKSISGLGNYILVYQYYLKQ